MSASSSPAVTINPSPSLPTGAIENSPAPTSTSVPVAVPAACQVLVIGAGPGGSYAASVLAREGLDVVLLEADVFPRYHIGESMLASMRHFLRFVDLDETFDMYGFTKKVGSAFKLNQKREGFTDFLAAGGPENYAWNVVRAEADDLMFRHAAKCGAKVFDGVKVTDIEFAPFSFVSTSDGTTAASNVENRREVDSGSEDKLKELRPISVTWIRKAPPSSSSTEKEEEQREFPPETGKITFDYLVDASGRAGILSTRYLKNRTFNKGLKNVASWGYWEDAGVYARGTPRENAPFFEALKDESGWAWLIPLHNGTTSVGVVMNQDMATAKKKACSPPPSARQFYLDQLKLAPSLHAILHSGGSPAAAPASSDFEAVKGSRASGKPSIDIEDRASLISEIKSASDYSYSASSYTLPYTRIVGDAGCFIDPYFSSGVHLALSSALSAATTICASLRGGCTEKEAMGWHDKKVGVGYTRFLMVVLSAYRQIRAQQQPVLSDFGEDNFDRAFAHFRPIIQGTADINESKLSQGELSKTLDFCAHAFEPTLPEDRESVLKKLKDLSLGLLSSSSSSSSSLSSSLQLQPLSTITNFTNGFGASDSLGSGGGGSSKGHGFAAKPNAGSGFTAAAATNGSALADSDIGAKLSLSLNEEEQRILRHIRARKMMRTEDTMNIASFSTDAIGGYKPRLERGRLGLERV